MALIMRKLALAALLMGAVNVSYGFWQVWQAHSRNERLLADPCAEAIPSLFTLMRTVRRTEKLEVAA